MLCKEKANPLSRFPKPEPGKPCILEGKRKTAHPCFCIQELYVELFVGARTELGRTRTPLIRLPDGPYGQKELLAFLLPADIFDQVEQRGRDGEPRVRDHDYREFFLLSTNNNKITKRLFDLFSGERSGAEKTFIEAVQRHFRQMLRPARFLQPQLTEYLRSLCDQTIVPASVSQSANAAAHALLDAGEHDGIAKAVANVFLSAMLGLYSMRYQSNETRRGFHFARTYLLNRLGMEFIWTPETISDSYIKLQDAQAAYWNGRYADAYTAILRWLGEHEGEAGSEELSTACQIRGACLYLYPELCGSGEGNETVERRREAGIADLERCVSLNGTNGEAHYLLYEYYKDRDRKRAFGHLKTAFTQNEGKAVLETAALFLRKEGRDDDITRELLLEKLTRVTQDRGNLSEAEVSEGLYLRGMLAKDGGAQEAAERAFRAAAERGHEKARQELSRKARMERQRFPAFSDDPPAPCCFVNDWSGNNVVFASTLPSGEWALFAAGECQPKERGVRSVRDVDQFLQEQRLADDDFRRPKVVFLFMGEGEERNLNECLMLLDKLFNLALEAPEGQRRRLIDRVELYVKARYEIAAMLLDASISDMGKDMYFKVHIADETRDAAHQLLCDAPLFLPYLNRTRREDSAHVVLFGATQTNYRLIQESVACAYLGEERPVTITLLGEGAPRLEKRLRQECPGLYREPRVAGIRPVFLPCRIHETDFPDCIYGKRHDSKPDDAMVRALSRGNYFVVDLGSDYDSIRFAMELRTWL